MAFNGHSLTSREVAYALVKTERQYHLAEIAPLPGFSQETLAQSVRAFYQACTGLVPSLPPSAAWAWDTLSQPPSLTTPAVDAALLHLPAGLSPAAMHQYIQQQAAQIHQSRSIKLKVARHQPHYEAFALAEILTMNPQLSIRCDANQGWQEQQFIEFAQRLDPAHKAQIEYIEEPCSNLPEALAIAKQQGLVLALDEHLQAPSFKPFYHPQLGAFVIKPSLVGSHQRCKELIDFAHQQGWQASLSSSFESPLGLAMIAAMAQRLTPDHSPGLDTAKYFEPNTKSDLPRNNDYQAWVKWIKHLPLIWHATQ
ncbi:o-succinylbenzoate synthase [Motilimonas pumila]|uniref:o-succinylbenzoate synthase n=2 Tax=Motilimonas pumila TaxID=2303987 RepID=A0A418YH68_9GAMM|nr:o-succinylbenzoate synthase [Motilimonas pumila]